jgi:hypothetical protein
MFARNLTIRGFALPAIAREDHLSLASQAIQHSWIPVIKVSGKVLIEYERQAFLFTPAAIRECNSVCYDRLRGRIDCSDVSHMLSFV